MGSSIAEAGGFAPARVTTDVGDILDYGPAIPDYLDDVYWCYYVKPWAIKLYERPWLVNLILWGWYHGLSDAAVEAMGPSLTGKSVQIACAYGGLTNQLAERVPEGSQLDVVDVVEGQLRNMRSKLPAGARVRALRMDSSDLKVPDATYDRALLFFLLHEMPRDVRTATLKEAMRVVKPGGKIVLIEFAPCAFWHPLKYLWHLPLRVLEPFAHDIWTRPMEHWLPECYHGKKIKKTFYFGRFYQRVEIEV